MGTQIEATNQIKGVLGVANGGTGTGTAFTPGSIVFAGASGVYSQDNANFFWDSGNHRLGIGTTGPLDALDVHGIVRITGTAGNPNYARFDNTANVGGRIWRFGDTGIVALGNFSIYDQTDNVGAIAFGSTGKVILFANIATAGLGVPAIYAQAFLSAQTTAVASVTAYTTPAADGTYLIAADLNITSGTGQVLVEVTVTDIHGTAQTVLLVNKTGVGYAPAIVNTVRVKASTTITILTTLSGTATYDVGGSILQID